MILKHKLTKKRIQISYKQFQTQFAKEIQVALESFIKTQSNKTNFKLNNNFESDFYFDLQWNFNHLGNSRWYIEKI